MKAKDDPSERELAAEAGGDMDWREERQSAGVLPFFISKVQAMGVNVRRALEFGWGRRLYVPGPPGRKASPGQKNGA